MDRGLGFALAIGALTCGRLCRSFLFGLTQLDLQNQLAPVVLVQRIVQTTLLCRIE